MASGVIWNFDWTTGFPFESLLQKADAHIVAIVIVSALLCALSGLVVAVSRGGADAPLACWLIAISGLLCRSALPLSGTSGPVSSGDAWLLQN